MPDLPQTATKRFLLGLAACLFATTVVASQEVRTRRDAVILYGTVTACSRPASLDFEKVQKTTPEWREIVSRRVDRRSGRYAILISKMNRRIRQAVAKVAVADRRDCVVRKSDITDDGGLAVVDLTADVIKEIKRG